MLTLKPMLTSLMSGMVGDERIIMDSGELLEKGTVKFCLLKPPLLDSFIPDDQIGMDLLPSNITELGVVHIDGSPENCWRPLRWFARDRED
jgi:hypothetical protein